MPFHLLKRGFVAGLALLFSMAVFSANATDGLVALPSLAHRVTDLTGTLSAGQQASLEAKLQQLEQQKGSQIAVLLVPTTQPEDIAQYSIRVAEAWKLGRKGVDDGVLVLVAKEDHKMRIDVGYGLEGTIPDVTAERIVSDVMAPHFKQGDFFGGIDAAVDNLVGLINGEQLPEPQRQTAGNSSWEGMLPLLLFGSLIVGGILRAVLGRFLGGAATGGLIGAAVWIFGGGLIIALVLAFIAFILTMVGGLYAINGLRGGGFGGGSGGGGFSGGGGGFGGGGASGSW